MGLFTYTALTRLEAPFIDGGIWLQADDDAFRHINLAKSGCGALRRGGGFVQSAPTLVCRPAYRQHIIRELFVRTQYQSQLTRVFIVRQSNGRHMRLLDHPNYVERGRWREEGGLVGH